MAVQTSSLVNIKLYYSLLFVAQNWNKRTSECFAIDWWSSGYQSATWNNATMLFPAKVAFSYYFDCHASWTSGQSNAFYDSTKGAYADNLLIDASWGNNDINNSDVPAGIYIGDEDPNPYRPEWSVISDRVYIYITGDNTNGELYFHNMYPNYVALDGNINKKFGVYARRTVDASRVPETPEGGYLSYRNVDTGRINLLLTLTQTKAQYDSAFLTRITNAHIVARVSNEGKDVYGNPIVITALMIECNTPNFSINTIELKPVYTQRSNAYRLFLESNDDIKGYVKGTDYYVNGETAHIEAVPRVGYMFSSWSDGSKEQSRDIVVTSDTELIANFVEYSPPKVKMTITSTIDGDKFRFVSWNDGLIENPRTINTNEDYNLVAKFESVDTTLPKTEVDVNFNFA